MSPLLCAWSLSVISTIPQSIDTQTYGTDHSTMDYYACKETVVLLVIDQVRSEGKTIKLRLEMTRLLHDFSVKVKHVHYQLPSMPRHSGCDTNASHMHHNHNRLPNGWALGLCMRCSLKARVGYNPTHDCIIDNLHLQGVRCRHCITAV